MLLVLRQSEILQLFSPKWGNYYTFVLFGIVIIKIFKKYYILGRANFFMATNVILVLQY